jgi:hypothetical protein
VQQFLQWKSKTGITYSECVFVALGTQHAKRRRRIIICGLLRLHDIFKPYLIKGTLFEKTKTLSAIKIMF